MYFKFQNSLKNLLLIPVITISLIFGNNHSIHFDFMSGYAESVLNANDIFGQMQPFTVEAWYKNDGVDSGNNSGYDDGANIVSSYRRSGGGDPYGIFQLSIRAGDSPENPGKAYTEFGTETLTRVDDGLWHHIAATYEPNEDGSWNFRIYLDGILNDETTGPDEDYNHNGSSNKIRMNNHSPFAGDHMLDCSYAGMSITSGAKYTTNFAPQFPLQSEENTIVNLDFTSEGSSQLNDNSGNNNTFNLNGSFQWSTDVPPTQGEVSDDDVFIEELTLNFTSLSNIESSVLIDDKEYYLKISGSYSVAYGHAADAAYYYDASWCNDETCPVAAMPWTWNGLSTQNPFPQGYNSEHIYYYYFTGDGTTEQFGFEDGGGYGDNGGSLTIQIWQRAEPQTLLTMDDFTPAGSFNGHNYFISNEGGDYLTGKLSCESLGGNLVTITSQEENDFVLQALMDFGGGSNHLWLGMDDIDNDGVYQWVTGEDAIYENFNNSPAPGQAVEMETPEGNWGDTPLDDDQDYRRYMLEVGEINHSLSFDGEDDYVELPDLGEPIDAMTIQFWLKKSVNSDVAFIMGQRGWSSQYLHFDVTDDNDGQKIIFSINNGGYNTSEDNVVVDDGWHNIAVTYENSTIKFYYDGNSWGEVQNNGSLVNINGFMLGNHYNDSRWLSGNLDNYALWNIALSQSEIQSHLNTELSGEEDGLIGYWNFNEGEGTTLNDLSGNGNHGTIYGATWSTDVPQNTTTNPQLDLTWSVQVSAQQGTLSDIDNYLGVADGATNEFDASDDELEPPVSPGDNLQIYFPHPEWDNLLGDYFSSDIRPEVDLLDTMQVWDMVVTSSAAGDVSLSFTFDDVPEVPVIIERVSSGVRTNLSSGDTYSVTLEAEEEVLLRVSVGDNTPPSLAIDSFPDGPAVYLTGSTRGLTWTADDVFEYDSAFVHLSLDSGQTYIYVDALGPVTSYQWTVPDLEDDITYGGMLRVEGRDYAGNAALIVNNKPFVIVGDSLGTLINAGWTLWGSPVVPAVDSMHLSLGDDFDGYWSTFDYLNGGYTYDGFLYQNRGYWLGSMENTEVDVLGGVSDTAVTMSLSPGWMLITNPLVLDVAVDSLLFNDDSQTLEYADAVNAGWVNVIYGHDASGYQTANVLKPWHGYWLAVLSDRIHLTFPIHDTPTEEVRENREDYWAINFSASGENVMDDMLVIGYHEQATDGFDMEYDQFTPPASPESNQLQLSVAHPEWNLLLGDHFSSDIRSAIPNGSFKEWMVNLNTNLESITLEAQLLNVPENLEVGYSTNGGIYFGDLREAGTLSLQTNENVIIRVGSQVLSLDETRIPVDYALNQNYPNPFNPTTMITYGLPKDGMVQVSIYDVMGREVRNLVSGFKDAGYHSVNWDARNMSGESVAAGMYIYTIQAGEFRSTKKMVLLK